MLKIIKLALKILLIPIAIIIYYPGMLMGRYVLGFNKLRSIKMPKLNITLSELEKIYGDEKEECVDQKGKVYFEYSVSWHHVVRVWVGEDNKTNRYVFVSARSSPKDDLNTVFERYGDKMGWKALEPGYLYWRNDDAVQVNCSIMPIIGVYLADKSKYESAPN